MRDKPEMIFDEWYEIKPSEEAKRFVKEQARAFRREAFCREASTKDRLTLPKEVVERYKEFQVTLGKFDLAEGYIMWVSDKNDQHDDKD
ncbi:hypothetical protein [Glutamicibacter sp. NPDC090743]|uniref:hypothetical protein n=1 Tax=Glutamicibacter sp. NPDC090743 TaxID=3364001 RepID=UPI00380240FA